MRRGLTPCIVGADHESELLQRIAYADKGVAEEFLQIALHRNPKILPVEEIDPAYAPLMSLGREVANIDNLFISPLGRITLVETKLWRNPQATREVVAQILEYATRLNAWSYEQLEARVRAGLSPAPLDDGRSLYALVASQCPDQVLPEEQFVDEVSRTLHTGRFMLLVVGDGIRENVEGLLGALHRHPQLLFTFAMVEVQIYDLPGAGGGRLVIPQLIAHTVEVVRAVVKVHAPDGPRVTVELEEEDAPVDRPGGGRRTLSEDEFFREVTDPDTARTCRQLLALADDIGAAKGWRASSVSVQFPDPRGSKQKVTLFVMQTDGEIYTGWAMQQLETLGLDPKLAADYARSVARLFRDVTSNPRQPDSLSRRLSAAEVDQAMVPFTAAVKGFVKSIEEASKG